MKRDFIQGLRAAIPISIGVIPVGISISILAIKVGFTELEAILMSALVFAGSSQLMAISMISNGAPLVSIIIGTFFINLRHIIMSSSIMQRLEDTSLGQRLFVSFAICDESFAVFSLSEENSYYYLLGINTALYVIYMASIIVGALITSFLPEIVISSFVIAFYAALLALLIPSIKTENKLIILVVVTGILNFILQKFIPSSWSVILSMIIGAAFGIYYIDDETLGLEKEKDK